MLEEHEPSVVEHHLWLERELDKKVEIGQAIVNVDVLRTEGYVYFQDIVIFEDEENRVLKKELLDQMLSNTYDIDRLFDKDTLIDMWVEGTTREEAIQNLIQSVATEELIDSYILDAYITQDGKLLKYIHIE